jgi:hypothetical protein
MMALSDFNVSLLLVLWRCCIFAAHIVQALPMAKELASVVS